MWQSTRHWSMVYASPLNLGFHSFTSTETLSSSSIKLRESQTVVTPAWLHTGRRLESWRRSSMASSSTISYDETMWQPMPSPNLGQAVNHPLWVCSCRICSSLPSGSRRISRYLHSRSPRVKTARYRRQGPCQVKTTRLRHSKSTQEPRSAL
jgi:hypothetical protein